MKTIIFISRYVVVPVVLLLMALSNEAFAARMGDAKTKAILSRPAIQRTINTGSGVDTGWADEQSQIFLIATVDAVNSTGNGFLTYTRVASDPGSELCVVDPVLGSYCSFQRLTYDALTMNFNSNDLTVSANSARFNTDLAQATNLVFTRCVYDGLAGGTYTCSDMPASGQINLELSRTSTNSVKSLGINEIKTGPQIVRITGSRQQYSADSNGSILGNPVLHQPGNLGTYKTVTVEIIKTLK